MNLRSVKRFEWWMLGVSLVLVILLWIMRFMSKHPNSLKFPSILDYPFFWSFLLVVLGTPLCALAEAVWIVFCVLSPGTLFDLERRRRKGMPYERIVPHCLALSILALTLAYQ